jgi:hypothetical protein
VEALDDVEATCDRSRVVVVVVVGGGGTGWKGEVLIANQNRSRA